MREGASCLNSTRVLTVKMCGALLIVLGGVGTALFGLVLLAGLLGQSPSIRRELWLVLLLVAMAVSVLGWGVRLWKRCTRAERYARVMDSRLLWQPEEMAALTGVPEETARGEILSLFRKGWLRGRGGAAQGQMGGGRTVRVEIHPGAQSTVPQPVPMVVAKCPSCGAQARVPADGTAVCAYCGRPLL